MARPIVIRGVLPMLEPSSYGVREYRVQLLDSTGRVELRHSLLRVRGFRLLVQRDPLNPRVDLVDGRGLRVKSVGKRMCRFHEGRGGRLLGWRYCTRPAVTVSGFCMDHRSSPQALYEKCNAGRMEACIVVDAAWRGESYSLYLLDYGSRSVKVGLTRTWRLTYRVAEQPHLAALELERFNSLYEARLMERRIGRGRGFTEGMGVERAERLERVAESLEKKGVRVAEEAARRLAEAAYRAAGSGSHHCITILPGTRPGEFASAQRLRELETPLTLLGYWAGVFLAETRPGDRVVFDADQLLHRVVYT